MSAERTDRVLHGLLVELADARTPDYLEAAIERASSRPQRPAWTFPGRWLSMEIVTARVRPAPLPWRQIGVLALIGILLATAVAAFVGSRMTRLPEPFGPAGNGVIALAKDGDIFVADLPGGALRPLVDGPEFDQAPMFSPDGTKLAFMRSIDVRQDDWALMLADADGTNIAQVATEASFGAESRSAWSFAPDGGSLMAVAQIAGKKRIVIRPVDPAADLTVLEIRLPSAWQEIEVPSFRPTNSQEILVVAEPDGRRGLYVYDLATGGMRTIVEPADEMYVQDVAWLPDGEHIIYGFYPHIVAADGSDGRPLEALRADRLSPVSNDGTRIVIDVAEVDVPGDDSHQRSVVVPIDGEGERIELACGLGMNVECAWSWIWSPDDSMLVGVVPHWTSSDRETSLPDTYLQADPNTGEVTELDWRDVGTLAWQRVAP